MTATVSKHEGIEELKLKQGEVSKKIIMGNKDNKNYIRVIPVNHSYLLTVSGYDFEDQKSYYLDEYGTLHALEGAYTYMYPQCVGDITLIEPNGHGNPAIMIQDGGDRPILKPIRGIRFALKFQYINENSIYIPIWDSKKWGIKLIVLRWKYT